MKNNVESYMNSAEYLKSRLIDFFISETDDLIIGNEIMYGKKRKVVDLLVLNNQRLTAIEIKGNNDDLRRIQEQIEECKKVFDYIIICTTDIHLEKLKKSIPEDIGIFIIKEKIIEKVRKPKLQKGLDKEEILYTLNAKYLKQLSALNLNKLNSDEVRIYYSKQSIKKIQSILYTYLHSKIEVKYKIFLSDRGESTHIDDIPLLSSFIDIQ